MSTLALACFCPDSVTQGVCQLISLTFVVSQSYTLNCDTCAGQTIAHVELNGNRSDSTPIGITTSDRVTGTFSFSLPVDTVFSTLIVTITGDASLFQPIGLGSNFGAGWYIDEEYNCINSLGEVTVKHVYSKNRFGTSTSCVTSGTVRSTAAVVRGGGGVLLFVSTPLGACNGSTATGSGFDNDPLDHTIDITESHPCLCATGGVPPYKYSVVGNLPSGQTLDPDTGCINGEANGSNDASSSTMTFAVTDSAGTYVTQDCNIITTNCPTCPPEGTSAMSYWYKPTI